MYAITPALIILVLGALTVGVGRHRTKVTYEPGAAWDHEPRLWAGSTPVQSVPIAQRVGTKLGGARGNW